MSSSSFSWGLAGSMVGLLISDRAIYSRDRADHAKDDEGTL